MKTFLTLIICSLTLSGIRVYLLARNTKTLMQNAVAFQMPNPNAKMKILVLGDSTMVGTGAINPINTTAGRLSSFYPDASIENISKNGLKLAGLNEMIQNKTDHYDLVLIQIGANDIIRLTSDKNIDRELDILLTKVSSLSSKIIILHSGDIGEVKFFPWVTRPIYTLKSKMVREIYKRQTSIQNISYVDLFDVNVSDKFYANDKIHLTDEGYGIWFEEIRKYLK